MRRTLTLAGVGAVIAAFALPAAASADCTIPGDPDPTLDGPSVDFNGNFDAAKQGSYVQIPFTVPAGATGIRVRYCYDQPSPDPNYSGPKHTLDVGVYGPPSDTVYGPAEQRGWSGSAVKDFAISANGYSPPNVYNEDPEHGSRKAYVSGYTTRAYQAGPITAGSWAVELGLASIVGPPNDPDGVDWRLRVETSTEDSWSDKPYSRVPYNDGPAASGFGWYSGDVHVHGEEEPGNSLMSTSFDFAFAPLSAGGAGLDFVGLVDHNNDVNTGEIGRYQPNYPGKLIIPGTEVTTYRGHYQNLGSSTFADFRGGPIYQRKANGDLEKVTDGIAPASQFGPIQSTGGWTQINHPKVIGGSVCRGCPWDYSDADTDFSKVDAIEVQNGAADFGLPPNDVQSPFTTAAIAFYEQALASGAHVAAVGSSDAHRTDEPGATIGKATTVVGATDLSRSAIVQGIRDGHTYVRLYGNDGPDIRVAALAAGDAPGTLGDTIHGPSATMSIDLSRVGASAARPGDYELRLLRNGTVISAAPIANDTSFDVPNITEDGRYSFEVIRKTTGQDRIEAYSTPVWYEPGAAFELGKAKLNKKKGTARLKVEGLRTAGQLSLAGKHLKKVTKAAGPGSAKLKVKPKGKLAKKLSKKGKAKVKVKVTFAPDGGASAEVKDKLKLKRKHKHKHR